MNGATSNQSPRSKRKAPSSPEAGVRPHKQLRSAPANGKLSADDNTPDVELGDAPVYVQEEVGNEYTGEEVTGYAHAKSMYPATMQEPEAWQRTIEKVISNVVSIRFSQTCSFDTDPALTSEATGFVVDAEKG